MHMVQVPHFVHKGCTNPNVKITTAFLGKNCLETIYGMSNFEFGPNFEKKDLNRGLIANLTNPHLMKWSNANLNLTTEFSSSFYPKIIYGGPCFENLKNKLI